MSSQNEFKTKAIELTPDELECVVGGSGLANAGNAAQTAAAQAIAQQMATIKTVTDMNDAVNSFTKNIGESAKSAAQ
jgi:accessory colonization factor AcfC